MILNFMAVIALQISPNAATEANHSQGVLSALSACGAIVSNQERLICYEREASSLISRQQSGDIVISDVQSATQARRADFGLSASQRSSTERALGVNDPDAITSTLRTARANGEGKMVFVLEDGSTWVQTDQPPIRSRMTAGMSIRVRKATLGSFFLNAGTGRDIRVRRLD